MQIYLGCPVWSFKGWVGNFYPKSTKSREYLREYAGRLTAVEGNTTFYAVPAQKTIQGWAAEMPDTFRFCPKIPKAISHEGKLEDKIGRAAYFVEVMKQLGASLGPMFLQLPPRYSPQAFDDLRVFLAAWPGEVRLAVEVRHLDWFEPQHDRILDQLLSDHNMARVTIDTRPIRDLKGDAAIMGSTYESLLEARDHKPDIPVIPKRTSDFLFVRYIGHPEMELNAGFLDEWGTYFVSQMRSGAEVFGFCHSPDNLIAPYLCRELHQRVAREVEIPPLPWDAGSPDVPHQGRLF